MEGEGGVWRGKGVCGGGRGSVEGEAKEVIGKVLQFVAAVGTD